MNTVCGMACILAGWLAFGAAFVGLGAVVAPWLSGGAGKRVGVNRCFWWGLAVSVAALQLLNLFAAIKPAVAAVVLAAGWLGCWRSRSWRVFPRWLFASPSLHILLRWHPGRPNVREVRLVGVSLVFLASVLFVLWAANRALGPFTWYDSGIYHFTSIRWANSYRLPPGLGNLHGRLAFNQSFFLYAALLNALPAWVNGQSLCEWGARVSNGLLLVATAGTLLELWHDSPADGKPALRAVLASLPLVGLFYLGTSQQQEAPFFCNPTPDTAVFLLELLLFAYAAVYLAHPGTGDGGAALVVALAVMTVTFKFSAVGFAGATAALVLGVAAHRRGEAVPASLRPALALGAVLAVVWLARGVVASGYLLYPERHTGLPVPWCMPGAYLENELSWIKSWARWPRHAPSEVLHSWRWLRHWFHPTFHRSEMFTPAIVAGLGLLSAATTGALRRVQSGEAWPWAALLGVSSAGTAFWFFTAPDLRFLGAAWWLVGISALGLGFTGWQGRTFRLIAGLATLALLVATVWAFTVYDTGLTFPPGNYWAYPVPRAELIARTTPSGLQVYTPARAGHDQCWDAPLPCTPYFLPSLRQRKRAHNLGAGFYLDAARGPLTPPE